MRIAYSARELKCTNWNFCISDNIWNITLRRERDFEELEYWHEGEKERELGQFVL